MRNFFFQIDIPVFQQVAFAWNDTGDMQMSMKMGENNHNCGGSCMLIRTFEIVQYFLFNKNCGKWSHVKENEKKRINSLKFLNRNLSQTRKKKKWPGWEKWC